MKQTKEIRSERIIDLSETISPENVKYFGEMMALCAFKPFVVHSGGQDYDRLYKGLILDIMRSNKPKHTFSDGYDYAQIAICFLCEHFGKKLNDILGPDRRGKLITIKIACLRTVSRAIARQLGGYRRLMNIDDFYHLESPQELETEQEEDFSVVDDIISKLGLNERQKNALFCRMDGMSYPQAARHLSMGMTTVFDIITKIRKLYLQIYSEPKLRARI